MYTVWRLQNSTATQICYEINFGKVKMAIFETLKLPTLISRKILSGSKILEFPHCGVEIWKDLISS